MRSHLHRAILPALLLTWALAHASVFGDDPKTEKSRKNAKDQTAVERIRKTLDQPMVLDFQGASLQESLQHLREKTGLEFNLDQMALTLMGVNINDNGGEPITLKSNGKLSVALRKLLGSRQLAYLIFEDSILITSSELATTRQMKQRVYLDVDEVPLSKALRDLARNHAFNLVIDPKIVKDAHKPVSLTLDGTSLETSVRLLAELAGLKAVRMDNVLFITNEERANKIRKEDKDMQPNADDPTMPGRIRMIEAAA
jgi:type II secretory pathway component HofQ